MKKGWEIKTLGDICENLDSKRVPVTKRDRQEGKYPYYGASGIVDYVNKFILNEDLLLVSEDGANLLARTYPIAFSISGETWVNNHAHVLRFESMTIQKFVEYYLNSIPLDDYVSGMAQPKLNQAMLNSIEIPIPPLPEQQRIVSVLDEAFASIAQAKSNAERNLVNARELFESYLQNIFENKGGAWEEKMLQDVVDANCTLSYGIVQPGEEYSNGLPVIRPTDLTKKVITLDGLKRIDPRLADSYKRTTLTGDELLLCVRGSTGVVSVTSKELKGANVTRGIVPIRFNSEFINQEFGYYLLISGYVQKQIKEKTYGAALMQINIGDLREILTPYPKSLAEQRAIVGRLEALSAETGRLEEIYQQKVESLEELKKSVLGKAFEGDLLDESDFAQKII